MLVVSRKANSKKDPTRNQVLLQRKTTVDSLEHVYGIVNVSVNERECSVIWSSSLCLRSRVTFERETNKWKLSFNVGVCELRRTYSQTCTNPCNVSYLFMHHLSLRGFICQQNTASNSQARADTFSPSHRSIRLPRRLLNDLLPFSSLWVMDNVTLGISSLHRHVNSRMWLNGVTVLVGRYAGRREAHQRSWWVDQDGFLLLQFS